MGVRVGALCGRSDGCFSVVALGVYCGGSRVQACLQGIESGGDVEMEGSLSLPFGCAFRFHVERQFVDVSLAVWKKRLFGEPEIQPFFFHQQLCDEVFQRDMFVGVENHQGSGFGAVAFSYRKPGALDFRRSAMVGWVWRVVSVGWGMSCPSCFEVAGWCRVATSTVAGIGCHVGWPGAP